MIIRRYREGDWSQLWPLLQITFVAGDTYAFAPDSAPEEIHRAWIEVPTATFIAQGENPQNERGTILGTYYIKPNQPGLGRHVCNCGYVVAPQAQGQGIATLMYQHSEAQALEMGFKAMQFNCVVSTNERAIRLWQKMGFSIVGTLPGAFHHAHLGYVDALVMFKQLVEN